MVWWSSSQHRRPISGLTQAARKSKRKSALSGLTADHAIPPPPPRPSRSDHHRPYSPALVRSKSPSSSIPRPKAEKRSKDAPKVDNNNPFDNKPWATPPVDRLVCYLDAQGYDYLRIVDHVKDKFPALRPSAISIDMLHQRLAMLDYRIDLDYFGKGFRKWEKKTKVASRTAAASSKADARQRRKAKGKARHGTEEYLVPAATSDPSSAKPSTDLQRRGSDPGVVTRGARHGKAILDHAAETSKSEDRAKADVTGPLPSSAGNTADEDDTMVSAGARHGKMIHQDRPTEQFATASPMFNNTVMTNSRKGRGIEHGKTIHHDRNQSTVSSTVTGTTAVNLPSADESRNAPDGLVYTRPVTPTASDAGATRQRQAALAESVMNPTPPLPPIENEHHQSRATKLGRAIQAATGQSWIPTPKGKLRVTNGMNKEELLTSPRSTPSSTMIIEDIPQPNSTPQEFKQKRSVDKLSNAKENQPSKHGYPRASADGRTSPDDGAPGPSSFVPKPLSVKRTPSAAPQPKKERIFIQPAIEETTDRRSHDIGTPPKVGK